ncbi:hypothetical protein C2I36_07175 [Rhodobacteraceae bacterium WD3A24]|nr:hypothetical protein C2I36_07175 [Rhodobacteraceae bacterium WD3A24]
MRGGDADRPAAETAAPPQGGPAEAPALRLLLERLAGEVDGLAETAAAIDRSVGESRALPAPIPPETARALQQIDLLRQALENVSGFIHGLAGDVDPALRVSPQAGLPALTLGDLATALLEGRVQAAEKNPPTAVPGDVQMF